MVIAGILVAIYFLFGRDDGQAATPPPPAPTTTIAPTTTTTVSECETRRAWLEDDASRYGDAITAAVDGRMAISDAAEAGADRLGLYGDYVRDYARALELWLRYEEDAEAVLRDCWDAFPADAASGLRDALAAERDRWRFLRSDCRGYRELVKETNHPDPWRVLGVSC